MTNVYKVKPGYIYQVGEEAEAKIAAQQQILADMELSLTDGEVYCTAEQAIELLASGFCGDYANPSDICKVYAMPTQSTEALAIATLKALKDVTLAFNERCNQVQPSEGTHKISKVEVRNDYCTERLQDDLDNGWILLAIQPQPDQRRPDYILGRIQAD